MKLQENKQYKFYLLLKDSFFLENTSLLRELILFFKGKRSLLSNLIKENQLNDIDIFEIIGIVYQNIKQEESLDSTNYRKHHGIYYTNYSIARLLAKESLKDNTPQEIEDLKFYEPCVGGGIFLIAYLDEAVLQLKEENPLLIKKLISNIYFSDIDPDAVTLAKDIFKIYVKKRYGLSITIKKSNYYVGNVLFNKNALDGFTKIDAKEVFKVGNGFDIILTNPPYKLLKTSTDKYSQEEKINNKILLDSIRKSKFYTYNQGTLNLYKIFIEEIIEVYLNSEGKTGLLVPSGLLKDKQSEKLRKRLLLDYSVSKIYTIPEKNSFFSDITQAFCFFTVNKKAKTKFIEIVDNVTDEQSFSNKPVRVSIESLKEMSEILPIVSLDKVGWNIVNKLNKIKKVSNINYITNLRGELDLTLNKKFITNNKKNALPLLKGSHISKFKIKNTDFYCKKEFLSENKSKEKYILSKRIVCQQISNISQKDRLKFALVDSNNILGNSCNFISISNEKKENNISLIYLLGILNSNLLNWRFKITNSNNHISNYEINDLPIQETNKQELLALENATLDILENSTVDKINTLNSIVYNIYKLTNIEIDYINNNS